MDEATKRFQRIEAIFQQTFDAKGEERERLLGELCGADELLRAEVYSLLLAWEESATAAETAQRAAPMASSESLRRIGPYELERLLGRGGMGAVYLARRADGQFEQQVAIKLIDLPLSGGVFHERFRQERQILAHLQHPYIARLLDGGVSESGDLYLAMEYVEGAPIPRYAQERRLNRTERVELFLKVCEAVQFAHQNLVVHRDLKPDNILVAADGAPRLLDFGTAKLLSASEPSRELTREGYLSFTPQYASPEQIKGEPITTASDTYSLGILLYLLLTGAPPYVLTEPTMAEMMHIVCEQPPRNPAGLAGHRLDPDLVAILLKALRKEPQARYVTVDLLAADLRAWLERRPVLARKGSFRYRAGKFVRRNWIALAVSAVLAASLAAGVGGVLWQAHQTQIERRKAEARAADLRQLSNSLLSELDEAIKQLPGSTGAQKLLVSRVLEHLDRMSRDAQGDRQTQLDLVGAYTQLANLQGNSYYQNLGDTAGALGSLDKASLFGQALLAASPSDMEVLRAVAVVDVSRSQVLAGTPRMQEALSALHQAIALYEKLLATPGSTALDRTQAATAYGELGDELGTDSSESLGDRAAATRAYKRQIELFQDALRLDPNSMRARRGLIFVRLNLGMSFEETDPDSAAKLFREGLKLIAAMPRTEQESVRLLRAGGAMNCALAAVLAQAGKSAEAELLFDKAEAIARNLVQADAQDVRALTDLQVAIDMRAQALENAAQADSGFSVAERQLALRRAEKMLAEDADLLGKIQRMAPGDEEWQVYIPGVRFRLGLVRWKLTHGAAARKMEEEGLSALQSLAAKPKPPVVVLDSLASDLLEAEPASLQNPHAAADLANRALALTHGQSHAAWLTLAQAYRSIGQSKQAAEASKQGLALLPAPVPGALPSHLRQQFQSIASR